jgi:TPR repeat protein
LNATEALAGLYEKGLGVPKSPQKAYALSRKAADAGLEDAYYTVAIDCETGDGTDHDPAEAFRYMSMAANAGEDIAMEGLGRYYLDGVGVAKNPAAALHWFGNAADTGYSSAKTQIGLMYRDGTGIAADNSAAALWFQRACQLDPAGLRANPSTSGGGDPDPEAFAYLGEMYLEGKGIQRVASRAAQLFQRGVSLGDRYSYGLLAHAYMAGEGIAVDQGRGLQLLSQGIEAGSITCMSMMAQTDLHYGNFAEARALFIKADAGGDEAAASSLAAIYEHGLGVKMDLNIAIYWYNKASQQGDASAAAKAAALMDIVEGRNKAPPPDR